MAISLSLVLVLGVAVWVLQRYAGLKLWHAAVCILFGFCLATTTAAPTIRHLVHSIVALIPAELDKLIDSATSGIHAKLEAAFDLDADLADIYARCGIRPVGADPDSPGNDRPRPRQSNPDPRRSP